MEVQRLTEDVSRLTEDVENEKAKNHDHDREKGSYSATHPGPGESLFVAV